MFSKIVRLFLVVAAAMIPVAIVQAADRTVAKIGVFLPLTGENAENGQQIKNAVELFVKQYNAAPHPHTIQLVIRDDRGEPKTATNIAREFAQDGDIVAVLGSFTSSASMAAAPILAKAGIPQISPTSSHPDFTGLGKFVFRGTPTQAIEASLIAEFVVKNLKSQTAAIVYRQDDWGNSASKVFQKSYEEKGGKILVSEAVAPDARDLRTLVTTFKDKNPSTVYVALQYSSAAVLAQRMRASGWQPNVIGATSLYTHQLVALAGAEPVEGWYVPAFFYAESTRPVVKQFVSAFTQAYGQKPNAFGAVGYDSIAVVAAAMEKLKTLGSAGRTPLGEAMFRTEVEGATGLMKFDSHGDVTKPVTWLRIQKGEFVPIQ